MKLFRAFKKIKAKKGGNRYSEEYIMLKKRPKSLDRPSNALPDNLDLDTHAGGAMANNKVFENYLETKRDFQKSINNLTNN